MHSSATSQAIARGVQLGHRDLAHRVLAVVEAPRRHVHELARRLDFRRHLGELVADHLELADASPNALRSFAYCERPFEAFCAPATLPRGADQALALELPHDVVEALADLAEHRRRGHAHVLEGQQRRVGGVHAELLELLLADHAGRVHRHEEQREAVVAGVRVGLRHEHDHVGAVAVGDVGLGAVDHVVVAVVDRARLDAGDVRAGVGLGDAEAEDLLALDRRHDPLAASAPRCRTRGSAASPCRCAPRRPSPGRRELACAISSAEHDRASSSRRPARRTPRACRGRGSRARPCGGRPSPGTSSPPIPRRAGASSLIAKLRIDSRSCSCSSVKMKCLRLALKSGFSTLSAVAAMSGGLLVGGCAAGAARGRAR